MAELEPLDADLDEELNNLELEARQAKAVRNGLIDYRPARAPAKQDASGPSSPVTAPIEPRESRSLEPNRSPASSARPVPIASRRAVHTTAASASFASPDWDALTAVFSPLTNEELISRLAGLAARVEAGESYDIIRDEFCAVSLSLNRLHLTPPRFRPALKGKRPPKPSPLPSTSALKSYPESDGRLSRDKQVIDLDWLHCAGKRDRIPEAGMEHLFANPRSLDWSIAEALAGKNWKPQTKAINSLCLSDTEQFQLAWLQEPRIKTRWNEISRCTPKVIATLKNRAERHPALRGDVDALARIWQVDELAPDAPWHLKTRLHQWILGTASPPWPTEKLREQSRRVKRHLHAGGFRKGAARGAAGALAGSAPHS
ncbi:hypothetical protein FSB08_20180 [Paraburkholderia sp. JPY432]|uniref:hypothetical protein n=1 Tax=Paraburkholderia youngii TaxID=2782701 RepID=UPI001594FCE5|nr:hypothetical protein [Paraburkholderia youngii]NVH74788.1 hypothetical protein [Paraburkholderia youngii]